MKKRLRKKTTRDWEWYSIKILYKCVITGERSLETVEEDSERDHNTFEETILLIKAPSEEQAYTLAEKMAIQKEVDYLNVYGQKVEWKFLEMIDCFNLFDSSLETGTELYSRFLYVPENIPLKEVISHYYPETVVEELVDMNFNHRKEDFNI